ncbi:MAG: tetratricopeptide repeat protein [Oscillospiraceae bacterium]|nr:tetratricopeptide repeat protein [Oscillospiraceae bacterium]
MSECFTRLYALPSELYAEGAPLLIAAGALLRDNQNGRLIAQLKLKNLDDRILRAVQVRLWPEDALGHAAESPVLYTYMDLNASRGGAFGAKNPILLPDPSTRNLRAEICAAVFADGSRWTAPEGAVWEPLPPAEPLEKALGDTELCKQLRLQQGADCRFVPALALDLWHCACGEPVKGQRCPICGKGFFEIDLQALTAARDTRLEAEQEARERAAAEAAARAEQKAAAAKKVRKGLLLAGAGVLAVLLIAASLLLGLPAIADSQGDKAAAAGDYVTALAKYEEASQKGLYEKYFHPSEKAAATTPAAWYQKAETALGEGRYEDAAAAFERAGSYRDAGERIAAAWYQKAEAAMAEGRYLEAFEAYGAAGEEPADKDTWNRCCLEGLRACVAAGELEKAEEILRKVSAKAPEKDLMRLYLGRAYLDRGDTETALAKIGQIKTSFEAEDQALLLETRYLLGQRLYETGDLVHAGDLFYSLKDYADADRYRQLCLMGQAEQNYEKGLYLDLLQKANKIDPSKLDKAEWESFLGKVYDWAKQIERNTAEAKGLAAAFQLYAFSGVNDYQARMKACNERYLTTPRPIASSSRWSRGTKVKINSVAALCHGATVTITVEYTASAEADWVFYPWKIGANEAYATKYGSLKKGTSSFSFDLPLSMLTDAKQYEEFWVEIEIYRNDSDHHIDEYAFRPLSADWAQDLYDRYDVPRP